MTRDADDCATAATASATDMGVHVDTDPNPATTGLPADEHISSFLLHIRRRADDKAAGLVLDDAPPDTGAVVASIQPRSGVMVMKSRQRYLMVPILIRPRLIRSRVMAVTPRQRYQPRSEVVVMRSRQRY